MANIDEYKKKLSAIGDAIREKTGNTVLLGLDEMPDMIRGIISGGNGLTYDMGSFVLDADHSVAFTVSHNLGKVPKLIIVWTDDFNNAEENPFGSYFAAGFIAFDSLIALPQRLSSTVSNAVKYSTINIGITNDSPPRVELYSPNSGAYVPSVPTESTFEVHKISSSSHWKAGVEYKYFVSEGFWG